MPPPLVLKHSFIPFEHPRAIHLYPLPNNRFIDNLQHDRPDLLLPHKSPPGPVHRESHLDRHNLQGNQHHIRLVEFRGN